MDLLFWLMVVATVVLIYVFWVRPLLKKNPTLAALYAVEETYFGAVRAKLSGIKQRLMHAFAIMATAVIWMHDIIAPKLTGVDVTPITKTVTTYIPTEFLPLIGIGFLVLLDWFRSIADKEMAAKIDAAPPTAPIPPAAPGG